MKNNPRDMIIYTGYKGKEMFDNTIKKLVLEETLSSTTFNVTQIHRLREMIHSDVPDTVEVASTLIHNNIDWSIKHV